VGLNHLSINEKQVNHQELAKKRGVLCGKALPFGAEAYRCLTCQKNEGMALCFKCFHYGNHSSHKWRKFFASGGGNCDCGY
jgi:hypothetical protein